MYLLDNDNSLFSSRTLLVTTYFYKIGWLQRPRGYANGGPKARGAFCSKFQQKQDSEKSKLLLKKSLAKMAVTVFATKLVYLNMLVELSDADQVREIIEHGFDFDDQPYRGNPPHGYYKLNVSINGTRKAYVDDDAVTEKPCQNMAKSQSTRYQTEIQTQVTTLEGLENVKSLATESYLPHAIVYRMSSFA